MQCSAPKPGLIWFWGATLLLVTAATAGEPVEDAPRPVRLRLEWGGGEPRLWNGLLEVSQGRLERPISLGVEADEPGSVWADGNAVWIQRRNPRAYDGFDVTALADSSATLTITLQSAGEGQVRERLEVTLAELQAGSKGISVGEEGARLVIRRAPGDSLPVTIERPHLVYEPGESFAASVDVGSAAAEKKMLSATFEWELRPARATTVLDRGRWPLELPDPLPSQFLVPLEIPLPAEEGAYDFQFTLSSRGLRRQQTSVQVVVVSKESRTEDSDDGGPVSAEPEEKLIDAFRPAEAGFFRRVERRVTMKRLNDSFGRLFRLISPNDDGSESLPAGPQVVWSAYRLRVKQPGHPHRLVVTAPPHLPQSLGISLLEPNAADQLMPVGIDSGMSVNPASMPSSGSSNAETPVRHEILFWPQVRDPILMLHDLGSGKPIDVLDVELYEMESLPAPTPASPVTTGTLQRLIGPYMHKPMLPENFGATEAYDSESRRSLDDWVTFHTAGARMAEYLRYAGFNSLMLAVLADGSTIYPSERLQPTPRYDTGIYFSSGQDPLRKDVLELLFRLLNREGLVLVPELQFSTPLPALERRLAGGGDAARGIELIGRDGRSWREARSSARGCAPYYNPLDPRVQQAVRDIVQELVDRYHAHDSFQGVAVELSSVGYLQFPGLNWGYDDGTIARFEQATGVRVPTAEGNEKYQRRYEFLTNEGRAAWLRWRSEELARFHRALGRIVTDAKPSARFILSGNRVLRGSSPDDNLYEVVKKGGRLDSLLPPKGLDFSLHAEAERLSVLRPALWGSPERPLGDALDETVNESLHLAAAFAAPSSGSLFYHLPRECRIPDFDEISPWQPAYTWLAAQASPAGPENRKRYAQALASGDAHLIFDGGWMIPLGQERHTRRARDVIAALPVAEFHTIDGQKQPVVVRVARHQEKTYIYAVNVFRGAVDLSLHLSCPATISFQSLGCEGQTKLRQDGDDGSMLQLSLEPYEIRAWELDDGAVRVQTVDVQPSDESLALMTEQIRQFHHRIFQAQQKPATEQATLENSGFEEPVVEGKLPGWEISVQNADHWTLDTDNPRSGRSSLVLTAGRQEVPVLSSKLPLENNRLVTMSVWLRGDREPTEVQLAFEATADGRPRVQVADVQVDTHWRRYLFRVKDIPRGRLETARVRIKMQGPGKLWIDDVDVELHRLDEDDLRQLTKVFSAITLAWEEERYADCERLLESYWGRFLFDGEPSAPLPSPEPLREAARFPWLLRR